MTGPYQRAIDHLASIFPVDIKFDHEVDPGYKGAFELAVAMFPAYKATEIAADVMKQRRYNALPPIAERCALFIQQAEAGRMFVNEYGRRSEIIGPDPERVYNPPHNGYKPPEHGPWYRVMVYWSDAEPSEDVMIWYTIGQPETRSRIIIDPALFVDLARHDKEKQQHGK